MLSLPAGYLMLGLQHFLGSWITSSEAPAEALKLIVVSAPFELTATAASNAGFDWIALFLTLSLFLVLSGVLFFLSRHLVEWIQMMRLRATATWTPLENEKHIDLRNLKLAANTGKKIRIAFLKGDVVPVTFGIRKPVILMPETLKSNTQKLNLAIRHELTHISQNDFGYHLLVSITQCFFWFHPLVHRLKQEIVEYRELKCDAEVLSAEDVSKKGYASLLFELLPMPNLNKEISVNMAQESSNLKKRIQMITDQTTTRPAPKRAGIMLFGTLILVLGIAMACTDMQTQQVFDDEELDLMTNIDETGERGYHQIIIYMSDEKQSDKHQEKLDQLDLLKPEHIHSIEVLKGDAAVEKFGDRAKEGVILINTKLDQTSYNRVASALGMNSKVIPPASQNQPEAEDYFVVVEEMPVLIGGLEGLMQEIRYPEMARKAGIEGRVYVQFVVNEQGDVENAQVIRGIGGGADEEALRVVRQAKFEPGIQRGRPVRVQFSLPILFKLGDDSSPAESTEQSSNDLKSEHDGITVVGYDF
jgi:TonB family protein